MSPSLSHFVSSLAAGGVSADIFEILDMGNPNFSKVPEQIRAATYLIAVDQGWQDAGILGLIKEIYGERYDEFTGNEVLSMLKELAAKHPNLVS